jgi:3,4-dehydroadipyl-CoA semialdehyde dehydrogenase
MKLANYVEDQWTEGSGEGVPLIDPVTGEELARASAEGIDIQAALRFARRTGGPELRAMTYGERAALLKSVAEVLNTHRDRYNEIALKNSGATQADCRFDVDGGIGTLKYYASLGRGLGEARFLMEPGSDPLSKEGEFQSAHILTPVPGVAVHINAFNFPSWGLWEKVAVSLLSGTPAFVKAATATSWLSQAMVADVVAAGILPAGALSLICAGGHDLMDHLEPGDLVAFTGSADTAAGLRGHPRAAANGIRFNVEADSLNTAILGPDAAPGSAECDALVKEVRREMTLKAGQKCTAIRRILVPGDQIDAVQSALVEQLAAVAVGDPRNDQVRMGPLVNKAQQGAAWRGLESLKQDAQVVVGGDDEFQPIDADPERGAFFPVTLLRCDDPDGAKSVHEVEVFGPVATLMPYESSGHAFALAARGKGSLVASVFTADGDFALEAATTLGPWHGRLALVDGETARANPGHGVVMPQCAHGGPGRAGGGEELGGLRALRFYHQRTAIQAGGERLETLRARAAAY